MKAESLSEMPRYILVMIVLLYLYVKITVYMILSQNYDMQLEQYGENVTRTNGAEFKSKISRYLCFIGLIYFSKRFRSVPQPTNGARTVSEELESLNKRLAQLSSVILERRNEVQVVIQTYKRRKQVCVSILELFVLSVI